MNPATATPSHPPEAPAVAVLPEAGGHRRRAVTLVAALVALLIIAGSASLHGVAERAFESVGALIERHPVPGSIAFVGLAALSAMLAFFSSAVLVPIGVQQWGGMLTGFLLWAGWLLGGATAYGVGRFLGARVLGLLVSPARLAYYQARVGQLASFGAVLLFQSAVPSEVPGYVLGTARYSFPVFITALALAELPYAVGAVLLGDGFLHRRYAVMVVLGVLGIGLITWSAARLHHTLSRRNGESE